MLFCLFDSRRYFCSGTFDLQFVLKRAPTSHQYVCFASSRRNRAFGTNRVGSKCAIKCKLTKLKNEFRYFIPRLQYLRLSTRKTEKTPMRPQNTGHKMNGATYKDSFFDSEGLIL